MTTMNPWINFNGNAAEAFAAYAAAFGGTITKTVRFSELASEAVQIPPADADKLLVIELSVGGAPLLYGNDVPSFMGTVSEKENRSKIRVSVGSAADVARIAALLGEGGETEGEPGPSPWGTYAAMLRDRYGIEWILEGAMEASA